MIKVELSKSESERNPLYVEVSVSEDEMESKISSQKPMQPLQPKYVLPKINYNIVRKILIVC